MWNARPMLGALLGGCAAAVLTTATLGARWPVGIGSAPDTVDVRMVRLVDAAGRPRLLLGAPLPDPQVQGEVYPRTRPVPGIMFLDTLGNETGGIGLFDDIGGGGLCFDYATAEAVCLTKATRFGYVGLTFLAPPDAGAPVGQSGAERVTLALHQGGAQLVLSDAAGRPRLRVAVDSAGTASIETLDEEGNTTGRFPGDEDRR